MNARWTTLVPLLPVVVFAVSWTSVSAEKKGRAMVMEITSSAFEANSTIPVKHTCDGEDLSPELSWTGVPENTKSLVLIMDDPDAPPGTWVHWVLYNLPVDATGLSGTLPKKEKLDNGAAQGLCWGVDSYSRVGYYGPCPPPGSATSATTRVPTTTSHG